MDSTDYSELFEATITFLFPQKIILLTSLATTILSKKDPVLCSLLVETCALLCYKAESGGKRTLTFQDDLSFNIFKGHLEILILGFGTSRLSRNVGKECPRRAQFWSIRTSRRKLELTYSVNCLSPQRSLNTPPAVVHVHIIVSFVMVAILHRLPPVRSANIT